MKKKLGRGSPALIDLRFFFTKLIAKKQQIKKQGTIFVCNYFKINNRVKFLGFFTQSLISWVCLPSAQTEGHPEPCLLRVQAQGIQTNLKKNNLCC